MKSRGKVSDQSGPCNCFGAEALLEDLDCSCKPGGENQPSKDKTRRVPFQWRMFSLAP